MKLFADLVDRLDLAARDDDKVALLADYFRRAPDPDRGAAISLLLDEAQFPRLSPAMTRTKLRQHRWTRCWIPPVPVICLPPVSCSA